MNYKREAEEIFLEAKVKHEYTVTWESHSFNCAKSAEKIARVMKKNGHDIDPNLAYACGLLHDIGRSVGRQVGLEHPILGYKMLIREGERLKKRLKLPENAKNPLAVPAQVSMTHTYYGYHTIDRTEFWEEFIDEEDLKFTQDFMEKVKLNDYDRLIQLVDNMAHFSGVMTIADRFSDVVMRHNLRNSGAHLRKLYQLKRYFDEKTGENIYKLFKNDIIRTSINPQIELKKERKGVYRDL